MQDWLNIKNKVIVVTGSASGIGKAIVEELLANGAQVQLADINAVEGELPHHSKLQFIKTDITDRYSVAAMVNHTLETHGRIDALVNNAGINLPRLLVDPAQEDGHYELNDDAFEKMVNVNQKGVYLMSQAVARIMVKQSRGVIVNISSESGLEGSEGQSCYAATKAAMYSFTRSWAKELGKHGIRVVGVAPGILEKTGRKSADSGGHRTNGTAGDRLCAARPDPATASGGNRSS
ncbi:SDR family NAD(P)-dependent oxidoreductase [Brenneria sp. hezel4-2-4]|nr:SDR family NAD(P)-dependent oxidoreductase [Brenneria sp. hezel4-2-4]